jgi:hypothetical protein
MATFFGIQQDMISVGYGGHFIEICAKEFSPCRGGVKGAVTSRKVASRVLLYQKSTRKRKSKKPTKNIAVAKVVSSTCIGFDKEFKGTTKQMKDQIQFCVMNHVTKTSF